MIAFFPMLHKSEEEKQLKQEQLEHQTTLTREIRDYVRTGDPIILRRAVFKLFVHLPITERFKKDKARALMLMMISDGSIQSTLQRVE